MFPGKGGLVSKQLSNKTTAGVNLPSFAIMEKMLTRNTLCFSISIFINQVAEGSRVFELGLYDCFEAHITAVI